MRVLGSRLDFQLYAVNRLPFIKGRCRPLDGELTARDGTLYHPFVAFFTCFLRAKAAACWLSAQGEEVYVHRFRANRVVEGKWHPARWVQSCRKLPALAVQCLHVHASQTCCRCAGRHDGSFSL